VSLLNGKNLAKGRATTVSALALKSRILLYAASDLHDIPTAKANSASISAFANPELLGYTSGDRTSRWQAAKNAAYAVIQAGSGGYKLGLSAPASSSDAQANYLSIAMGGGSNAPGVDKAASAELLFERDFSPQTVSGGPGTDGTSVGLDNGPNGYHNWAGNAPIQQLVDDYEMMDGTKFSWTNPAQAVAPYKNRTRVFTPPSSSMGLTGNPAVRSLRTPIRPTRSRPAIPDGRRIVAGRPRHPSERGRELERHLDGLLSA